jgi:hypothetical protein
MKLICAEFGSVEVHEPPPPVQAEGGRVTTVIALALPIDGDPEHPAPSVTPPQVNVSEPASSDGPPLGEKSAAAWTVIDPPPDALVIAR